MATVNTGDQKVSPQMARSIATTQKAMRKMHEEFGLLTIGEVAGFLGVTLGEVLNYHDEGRIMSVNVDDEILYPAFQFNEETGAIRPVIADLIAEATSASRSESSLELWMVNPTGYLDGKRPVDCLDTPDSVLLAARNSFNVEW